MKANPDKDELALRLAKCHLAIGKQFVALGDFHSAMTSLVAARMIIEKLTVGKPDQEIYQASLADCFSELGIIQGHLESGDSGLEILQKAKKIQQELIGRSPANKVYRKRMAEIINALSFVYAKRLDYSNASRCLRGGPAVMPVATRRNRGRAQARQAPRLDGSCPI